MKRIALGRGLDALITPSTDEEPSAATSLVEVELAKIRPNPYQPRRGFDEEKIRQLAESIRQRGLIQPVVLRKLDGGFELVIGERRLRAATYLGMQKLPALVYDALTKQDMMELALIENVQREDLNPLEEAQAYKVLLEECGLTQEQLAQRVGKDRSSVANTLRLLSLPDRVKQLVASGELSEGAARVILALPDQRSQTELAQRACREGLSVRRLEMIVYGRPRRRSRATKTELPPTLFAIQEGLKRRLQTKVTICPRRRGGSIVIDYYDDQSLSRILDLLNCREDEGNFIGHFADHDEK